MSQKFEKSFFYLLVFCLPLQVRHIFYSFGEFNEWKSIYLYGTDILVLGLVVLWAARIIANKKTDIRFGAAELALAAFLAVSALSLAVATNLKLGIYSWLKLLEFSVLFLYVKNNFFKFSIIRFWQVFIAGAIVQSIVGVAQFFKQSSLGLKFLTESPLSPALAGVAKIAVDGKKIVRAYGLTPHPNILAAILVAAIFGLAWLWLVKNIQCYPDGSRNPGLIKKSGCRVNLGMTTKRKHAIFFAFIFLLLILSVGLFFTFSRAIMAAGFVFLFLWLVFVFWRCRTHRKSAVVFFLLLTVVCCLLAVYYWPLIASRFSPNNLFSGQALELRGVYNQVALEFIKKSPFWGIGQGNFVDYFSQSYNLLQNWLWQPVHNIYLLMAAETGALGLLAFLAFLFFTVRSAWPCRKDLFISCFLFLAFCLLTFGFFDHFLWDLQQGQILFWLVLGIISAHSSMDRSPASEAGN